MKVGVREFRKKIKKMTEGRVDLMANTRNKRNSGRQLRQICLT